MSKTINRRKFFRNTAFSAAGIMLGSKMLGSNLVELSPKGTPTSSSINIMKEVMKYRKITAHEHVGLGGTLEEQINVADRLGIDKLEVSKPISAGSVPEATPE